MSLYNLMVPTARPTFIHVPNYKCEILILLLVSLGIDRSSDGFKYPGRRKVINLRPSRRGAGIGIIHFFIPSDPVSFPLLAS